MSAATTWEQATQDVAIGLPSFSDGDSYSLEYMLREVEELLDEMKEGGSATFMEGGFRELAWLGAVGYVHEKWDPITSEALAWTPAVQSQAFVERCNDVVNSTLVLLPKKQHDYGSDNILWGGVQGVVVRAHDKLARIKNLRARAAKTKVGCHDYEAPRNEPLADSYFDLIGYGIVGAMLVKGTFQLPLAADVIRAVAPGGTLDQQRAAMEADVPKSFAETHYPPEMVAAFAAEHNMADVPVAGAQFTHAGEEQIRKIAEDVLMELTHEGFSEAEEETIKSWIADAIAATGLAAHSLPLHQQQHPMPRWELP